MDGQAKKTGRWNKRESVVSSLVSPFSMDLQEIAVMVDQRQFEPALARINSLLSVELNAVRKARLVLMVATIELRRKNLPSAISYFQSAAEFAPSDPSIVSAAQLGVIRAQLAGGDVSDAETVAEKLFSFSKQHAADYAVTVRQAEKIVLEGGTAVLPADPGSIAEVFDAAASAFDAAGCYDQARKYWTLASEQGSFVANAALARLAARQGLADEAVKYAFSSLVNGKYKAGSLSAIRPAILSSAPDAVASTGARILRGLRQASPDVRDRGVLETVKALRSAQDESWKTMAAGWLAEREKENSVVAAELRKLLVVAARKDWDNPGALLQLSEKLAEVPQIAPEEWLMAAKEIVRSRIALGGDLDYESLLVDGAARFGSLHHASFAHGLGLAFLTSGRQAEAEGLFRRAVALTPFTEKQWAISSWSLAKVQNSLAESNDAYRKCAGTWESIAANPNVDNRFRLCARLQWLEIKNDLGEEGAATACYEEIAALCRSMRDVTALLLVARQLRKAPGDPLQNLGRSSLDKAISQSGISSRDTLSKTDVKNLLGITLIQHDYQLVGDIFATWERRRRSFEAVSFGPSPEFWSYSAAVIASYSWCERWSQAQDVLQWVLAHRAVTPFGRASAWGTFGKHLMYAKKKSEAFELFRNVESLKMLSPEAGIASYWLGLEAYRSGQGEEMQKQVARTLEIFSNNPALYWQRATLVKTLILTSNFDIASLPSRYGRYSEHFRERCLASLKVDLERLS